MFDLITSPAQLTSANAGMGDANYRQVTATRNVGLNSFGSAGIIQFRFQTGGNTWWIPGESYFRIRCTLNQVRVNGGAALPPLCSGDLAPNMGMAANLFKTVEVQINGDTIERVGERLAQIDALKTRMKKSKAWIDSVGEGVNFWGYDHEARKQQICADGYVAEEKTWNPTYPVRLTAVQAGFDALNSVDILTGENIADFTPNAGAAIDIVNGKMALRPGDLIQVAAGSQYEVIRVINGTQATVKFLDAPLDTIGVAAVDFFILPLNHASRNDAVGKNSFELIWQPPLGFFDRMQALPPGAVWTIEFDPENVNQFQIGAVESTNPILPVGGAGLRVQPPPPSVSIAGDFAFSVDQMYFYAYTVEQARFDKGQYYLDLQSVRCQQENMATGSTSLIQKNFDVSGKTNALTLAFQDQSVGTNTLFSRSKFKIRPGLPAAGGGSNALGGQELLLTRFYLQYNNKSKPSPDFDGKYVCQDGNNLVAQSNNLTQRWTDSMLQAGGFMTEGGSESFKDWISRGPYYHFSWPKDATDNTTRVNLNYQFEQAFEPANSNHKVLMFNWYRNAIHVVHENGQVKSVTKEEL